MLRAKTQYNKEITKMSENKITKPPVQDLSYLEDVTPEEMGTDNIDNADIIMPRLKLVQGLTTEKFGAKDGEIINSVTGKNYGKKVKLVPIIHFKTHMLFTDELGVECRSMDAKVSINGLDCNECGKYKFGDDHKAPACNTIFNYLVAEEGELKEALAKGHSLPPLILSFMKTGIRAAKVINTSIKLNASRGYPIYGSFFEVTASDAPQKFTKGQAFVLDAKVGDYVEPTQFVYLKSMFKEYSTIKLDVDKSLDVEDVKAGEPDSI